MSTLADAVLSAPEKRALERFARELERELGDELRGVWLYGSRARGERTGPESDVDLLVITDGARERDRLSEMLNDAAEAEGADRFFFSIQVYDLDWLADRRGTEAFFVKEVDRDRIVLAGDPDGLSGVKAPPPELQPGEMRPRTKELLEEARERIEFARLGVEAHIGTPVVSIAYYAALSAARAALSEEDRHTRSHTGTWGLFGETFVVTGRFDAGLHAAAHALRKKREYADYAPVRYTPEEARTMVETCERFVTAVEAMLGVERE